MTQDDAITAMFNHVIAATPIGVITVWEDVPASTPDSKWIRPRIQHAVRNQQSLSNHSGQRMFQANGVLSIDCFALAGDGLRAVRLLSDGFVRSLEAIRGSDVWYRNIRAIEQGKDGAFTRVLVLADFEYTDSH
jgi:hypothetical protein